MGIFTLIIVAVVAAVIAGLLIYKKMFYPSSPNPFAKDTTQPRRPLVTDQKLRDNVLKQSFTPSKVPKDLDAIVIGSGVGGLANAAILSKAGKKVLVLEQHDQAGGCCHTYHEKGYEFDVGIHYIGKMGKGDFDRSVVDQLTDGQLDWAPLDSNYDVVNFGFDFKPERTFPVPAGKGVWKEELLRRFPQEEVAIEKFFQQLRKCNKSSSGAFLLKLAPLWVSKILISTGIIDKITPYFKFNQTTAQQFVETLTDNKDLQANLLYSFGDFGTAPSKCGFPMQAVLHNHFAEGAYYPVGGASEIAFNMIPVIERGGGKVLVRAMVTKIVTDGSGQAVGVRVKKSGSSSGEETYISAPLIISDAGIYNTFQKLLPDSVAKQSYYRGVADNTEHGTPLSSVFLGLDIDDSELDAKAQNIWAFSHNDLDKLCADYLSLTADEAIDADIPLLFVSFPSKKDPTWRERYPGKSTCAIVTLSKYDWFKQWDNNKVRKRGDDYDAFKNAMGQKMIAQTEKLFPQIKDHIDYVEVGSPVSNNYYLNAPKGEVYGMDHTQERFGPQMTATMRPDTDVPGLYLTGQDVTGCGFSGALWGGILSAMVILGRQWVFLDDLIKLYKETKASKKTD